MPKSKFGLRKRTHSNRIFEIVDSGLTSFWWMQFPAFRICTQCPYFIYSWNWRQRNTQSTLSVQIRRCYNAKRYVLFCCKHFIP